jgi:hypothetical protein
MGFISSEQMIEKLTRHLELLVLPFEAVVIELYSSSNMVNNLLQNGQCQLVVSVKRGDSVTHRVYNGVPCSDNTMWEIGVWMHDTPHYDKNHRESKVTLFREQVVEHIKNFFKLYPSFGTQRGCQNKDHTVKQLWVLQTNILVSQLNEELTTTI